MIQRALDRFNAIRRATNIVFAVTATVFCAAYAMLMLSWWGYILFEANASSIFVRLAMLSGAILVSSVVPLIVTAVVADLQD